MDFKFIEDIEVTDQNAATLGAIVSGIALTAGAAAPYSAAIGLGVEIAAKLCDGGYDVPHLEELLHKRDELAGLSDLVVVTGEDGALKLVGSEDA
jgi:hypothetical protein